MNGLLFCSKQEGNLVLVGVAAVFWIIWKTRNNACFHSFGQMIQQLFCLSLVLLFLGLVCRETHPRNFCNVFCGGYGKTWLKFSVEHKKEWGPVTLPLTS